jgi:hypothetical protein
MLDLGLAPGKSGYEVAPLWIRRVLAGLTVYFIEVRDCVFASANFDRNRTTFKAIIVAILLYWCHYYTRVFSSEAHPRISNVVQFYKVLLAFMFVFEMTMR